jgi:ribosomal protein L7Ae-like RNA K-turn-binding protein
MYVCRKRKSNAHKYIKYGEGKKIKTIRRKTKIQIVIVFNDWTVAAVTAAVKYYYKLWL